jgi:hypothetical protein
MGTVYAGADKSNLANCLQAVEDCDAFLGIIRPTYGSGVLDETSITHQEVLTAIQKGKARWFLVDSKVTFTRQLLKKTQFVDRHSLRPIKPESIIIKPNDLIDIRCIDIYNELILDKVPANQRIGHWVKEYNDFAGMQTFIEGQFKNVPNVRRTIKAMKKLPYWKKKILYALY